MKPPYDIHRGDCLQVLRGMADNSVDAVVTDPPYGISFMGKKWDYDVPAVDVWAECLRVLKPGGYLMSFGGTRTYHRLATRIEDAGFELHPLLAWIFASGFPKATRVDLDGMDGWRYGKQSLKPALEPICFAQKPFSEATGTANIARWGTGAINIDGCRVPTGDVLQAGAGGIPCRNDVDTPRRPGEASADRVYADQGGTNFAMKPGTRGGSAAGRWPANLCHDGSDEVVAQFPGQAGQAGQAGQLNTRNSDKHRNAYGAFAGEKDAAFAPHDSSGSAARFFYCAKASRADRNEGCEHMERKPLPWSSGEANPGSFQSEGTDKSSKNNHPTVKPTDLMRWLCRLVTPAGGIVLDPYAGSGSTGKAAVLEGFQFIGVERDADENGNSLGYIDIINARLSAAWDKRQAEMAPDGQFQLFG